jgi:hypothetical protein
MGWSLKIVSSHAKKSIDVHFISSSPVEFRTLVRLRGIKDAFKALRPEAEPRTLLQLLVPGLTKGHSTHQQLPGIRPAIRMGMVGVIHLQVIAQLGFKVLDRTKVAPFSQTAHEDPEP